MSDGEWARGNEIEWNGDGPHLSDMGRDSTTHHRPHPRARTVPVLNIPEGVDLARFEEGELTKAGRFGVQPDTEEGR